jgi:hypothetical protein
VLECEWCHLSLDLDDIYFYFYFYIYTGRYTYRDRWHLSRISTLKKVLIDSRKTGRMFMEFNQDSSFQKGMRMARRKKFKDDPARPDLDHLKDALIMQDPPEPNAKFEPTPEALAIQALPSEDIEQIIDYAKRTMGKLLVDGMLDDQYQYVAGTVIINSPHLVTTLECYQSWLPWLQQARLDAIHRLEQASCEARHKQEELMKGGSKEVQ